MRLLLAGCLLGAALAACGGSSSETPWPAEPQNASLLGPAGESPSGGAGPIPDAGAPAPRPTDRAPKPE